MSYPFSASRLAFFEPIMDETGTSTKPLAAVNLAAANGTHGEFVCVKSCTLRGAEFAVTLQNVVGTTTAPYVVLTKYTIPGAGGTATVVGTITVPNGAVLGNVYYKKDLGVSFNVGDVLQVKWVIATGGSVAGKGHVAFSAEPNSVNAPSNSHLIASST